MTPERWQRIEQIYHAALDQESQRRAAYVAEVCQGDESLQKDVESLLARDASSPANPLNRPAISPADVAPADAAPADAPLAPGVRLGPYEILSAIGAGGMGEVYKARDTRLDRVVALKVAKNEFTQRFEAEARAIAALNHPHICTLHDVGTNYFVMEYVDGQPLREMIPRDGLALARALDYAAQIAEALAAPHASGIVHRDLKPGNIMITGPGSGNPDCVKVVDFGLASVSASKRQSSGDSTFIESEGAIAGTVAYMSPEQAQGHAVDARSDIFSFGAVLYEMLTGVRAFAGDSPISTLAAIIHKDPRPAGEIVAGLPHEVDALLGRCLQKDPARRWGNMGEVKAALRDLEASAAAPTRYTPAWLSSRWRVAGIAALAVALAAGVWMWRRPASPPTVAAVRQITRSAGLDMGPSFSPDGSQIAFSSNRSGRFEIYVRSLAADGAERQISSDKQDSIQPAWSPDGRYVAYVNAQHGGVKLVPASGGPSRYLTDIGDSPQWSPDSRTLAIREYSTEVNPAYESTRPDSGEILALVDAQSGALRALTDQSKAPFNPSAPRWLTDGRRLLFTSQPPDSRLVGLWIADVASHESHLIHSGIFPLSAVLSLKGGYLYFTDRAATVPGIWRGRTGRNGKIESAEPLIPMEGGIPRDLIISADGSRLAFSQQTGESDLWSIPVDSKGAPAGEPKPVIQDRSFRNTDPVYSPDGSKLAWCSSQTDNTDVIYVANADGSSPVAVTTAFHTSLRPQWVGKDLTLAYLVRQNGEFSYWIAPLQGRPERIHPSLDLRNADRLRLSRDGTTLVAQITTPVGLQLVVTPLRGGPVRAITPANRNVGFPLWSPDGRWVAAQERLKGRSTLVVVPSAGGEIKTLAREFTQYFAFDWSMEGDRILFAGLRDSAWNIYWASFPDGKVQQITHFTMQSGFVRYPSWSPKGDWIVFEHNDLRSNIYVADLKFSGQ